MHIRRKSSRKLYVVQYSYSGLIVKLSNFYLAFCFFHATFIAIRRHYLSYRIFSIKRRPRINAAPDQMPQLEAKLPINAAPNQKNAAFTRR